MKYLLFCGIILTTTEGRSIFINSTNVIDVREMNNRRMINLRSSTQPVFTYEAQSYIESKLEKCGAFNQ